VQRRAAMRPAGEDEVAKRRQLGVEAVDECFEAEDVRVGDDRLADPRGQFLARVGQLRARVSSIGAPATSMMSARDRFTPGAPIPRTMSARTRPSQAFSSSTSPYVSSRGSSLRTRVPSKYDVSPESPVRVYSFIVAKYIKCHRRRSGCARRERFRCRRRPTAAVSARGC
jgi:hypothetical protein